MLLDAIRETLRPNRRNVAALCALVAFGLAVQFVSNTALRYGIYLLAFVAWMAWFVETCVEVLRRWDEVA
ncbi:hypothetical protein ACFQJD_19125 [Haloplanus sp. GCM10025708]|uniref:hypothetical protein n=1 Tax=Haloferacaceae TaxID=1644056 RepID=UPI00361B5D3D